MDDLFDTNGSTNPSWREMVLEDFEASRFADDWITDNDEYERLYMFTRQANAKNNSADTISDLTLEYNAILSDRTRNQFFRIVGEKAVGPLTSYWLSQYVNKSLVSQVPLDKGFWALCRMVLDDMDNAAKEDSDG